MIQADGYGQLPRWRALWSPPLPPPLSGLASPPLLSDPPSAARPCHEGVAGAAPTWEVVIGRHHAEPQEAPNGGRRLDAERHQQQRHLRGGAGVTNWRRSGSLLQPNMLRGPPTLSATEAKAIGRGSSRRSNSQHKPIPTNPKIQKLNARKVTVHCHWPLLAAAAISAHVELQRNAN